MVRDHGPGVPEEMLRRLFEPFVRVGDARDRASGGYGLGLAIAQKAIRLHGGDVSALNARGGGLLVTVKLPVEPRIAG
jgi:signal transduction histidine kinase